MKIVLLALSLIIFLSNISFAQSKQIIGRVVDNSTKKTLQDASIVLLNKKDSFIVAETRSDYDGQFNIDGLNDRQTYILFISYPRYVSYSTIVDVKQTDDRTIYIADIELKSQTNLLEEVIVKAKISNIRMRGDTVEYSADKIKLPPNATVEELLKMLQGLHVDQKGQITAQGKRVRQVYIDGEEFFSDDPCLVTRNLRANMISTVQVYDKKSDAATFTGIDDGIKNRIINLKLKQDKNNGIFGKIEAGAGPGSESKNYYAAQEMINVFKPKNKASAFLSSNNIGQAALGSNDKEKLGTAFAPEKYDGKGLPNASAWGLHYDNKWNKDKSSVNGDYTFFLTGLSGYETVFSQNNLPTGIIDRNSVTEDDRKTWAHKANVSFKQKIDSSTNLSIFTAGVYGKNSLDRLYNASDKDGAGNFLNKTSESIDEAHDFSSYTFNLLLQKKFKNRTFSIALDNLVNNKQGQQTYLSTTHYYNGSSIKDSTRMLNLLRKSNDHFRKHILNLAYTERIGKFFSLLANYNAAQDFADDDNRSFPALNGPVSIYKREFSTIRVNEKWAHTGNLQLNYTKNKNRVSAGNTAGIANMTMNDEIKGQQVSRRFQIWKPMFRVQHNVNNNTNFSVTYRGNTVNPEFQQLAPYAFNNTQLITYYENPTLTNSFSNNVCGTYESFRNFTKAFTAINVNHTWVSNPISLSMYVNESGTYSLQYVNMPGYTNRNFEITGFYSRPVNRPKLQLTLDGNIRGGNNFNLLNGAINKLNYEIYSLGVFGSRNQANKYDIYLGATGSYNSNSITANKEVTHNNFYSFSVKPAIDIYFLKKLQLHSDGEYIWQGKSEVFKETFDRFIWNAWIGGNFLKNKQLTIKLSCNDILNANTGISRIAAGSFFTENRFITIRRYYMATAAWNFTKFKMVK